MIIEYHRPATLEEALSLLARPEPLTLPLAGGTVLNQPGSASVAAVDLQALGLDQIQARGNSLELGATLTLQGLVEAAQVQQSLPALVRASQHEASYNLRQVASLAGTLVAAGGRSPFATAMLALDAVLNIQPGDEQAGLGDWLPLREPRQPGRLITSLVIPLHARLAYEYVARTPADRPIVCAALAVWPSGRVRLALGGYGRTPRLAFDGTEAQGVEIAASSAYSQAGDEWASAAYRQEVAGVLAKRCLQSLNMQA
ncbi:MAG: FAD binding domain-containing protein [Chloroflexota bacterium]